MYFKKVKRYTSTVFLVKSSTIEIFLKLTAVVSVSQHDTNHKSKQIELAEITDSFGCLSVDLTKTSSHPPRHPKNNIKNKIILQELSLKLYTLQDRGREPFGSLTHKESMKYPGEKGTRGPVSDCFMKNKDKPASWSRYKSYYNRLTSSCCHYRPIETRPLIRNSRPGPGYC